MINMKLSLSSSLLFGALSYVSAMDIVDTARSNGSFNTLAAALGAGLADLAERSEVIRFGHNEKTGLA